MHSMTASVLFFFFFAYTNVKTECKRSIKCRTIQSNISVFVPQVGKWHGGGKKNGGKSKLHMAYIPTFTITAASFSVRIPGNHLFLCIEVMPPCYSPFSISCLNVQMCAVFDVIFTYYKYRGFWSPNHFLSGKEGIGSGAVKLDWSS